MSDFKSALKSRMSRLSSMQAKLEKEAKASSYEDNRFWKLEAKDGVGSAIIRFLPPAPDQEDEYVKYFRHEFKGPHGWLIDNCLTSIGKDCPICQANNELWSQGGSENEDLARTRKRKTKYVSNILVVQDGTNPSNEGKVFLFQYGQKIFEFIQEKINPPAPEFSDMKPEEPAYIFDFLEGCNFRLRMRREKGYITYDKSSFDSPTQLAETDEEMEAIWRSEHPLSEFTSDDYYKSYEDLNKRFQSVTVGNNKSNYSKNVSENAAKETVVESDTQPTKKSVPDFVTKSDRVTAPDVVDELAFFEKLASE
jgi:hypothetical protein